MEAGREPSQMIWKQTYKIGLRMTARHTRDIRTSSQFAIDMTDTVCPLNFYIMSLRKIFVYLNDTSILCIRHGHQYGEKVFEIRVEVQLEIPGKLHQ